MGTAGALGAAVQVGQINDLNTKVNERALSSDLTKANGYITAIQTAAAALTTRVADVETTGAAVLVEKTSICTSVSRLSVFTINSFNKNF